MPVVTRSQARAQNELREWRARDHRQPLAQRPVLIDESTVENKLRSAAAAAHVRYHRQPLAQRPVLGPSPLKIDFSKVKSPPVSESFVFPKSTEQKLEEALAEIAELKLKQGMMEDEINRRVAEEINRRSGSRPNYMKGWIQPSKE